MPYEVTQELEDELTMIQRKIIDEEKAVLVVFEGHDERVQEMIINEFLNLLDPRVARYSHFQAGEKNDPRTTMKTIGHEPAKGKIAVYDRSWYSWLAEA